MRATNASHICHFRISSNHLKKRKKKWLKFNNKLFQNNSFKLWVHVINKCFYVINIKVIDIFCSIFSLLFSKSCIFDTFSTSQFRLAMFWLLSSHVVQWLPHGQCSSIMLTMAYETFYHKNSAQKESSVLKKKKAIEVSFMGFAQEKKIEWDIGRKVNETGRSQETHRKKLRNQNYK